ncbi:MAG: glycosyltransferase [Saprospiraceae bacterium]
MSIILNLYIILSVSLALLYVVIILVYRKGWNDLPENETIPEDYLPTTNVSVLVAARNEEKCISSCIDSIKAQKFPVELLEIIVIDDHSTDRTYEVAVGREIRVIQLSDYSEKGSKKKAIETGIRFASGKLIVTTDADCIVPGEWLLNMVYFYETAHYKFIAAPVNFHQEQNTFEKAQSLDFLGLMLITGAGIHKGFMHMCNGANLAYEREVFYQVGGFEGIDQLASGDDMLLMQKVALQFPGSLGFLKSRAATVLTTAKPTVKSFIYQRIRWASKTNSYKEFLVTAILAAVFLLCCNIIFSIFLIPFLGKTAIFVFLFQILVKALMDYLLLQPAAVYFKRSELLAVFIPAFFGHILYMVIVGILANLVYNYEWKGRLVR